MGALLNRLWNALIQTQIPAYLSINWHFYKFFEMLDFNAFNFFFFHKVFLNINCNDNMMLISNCSIFPCGVFEEIYDYAAPVEISETGIWWIRIWYMCTVWGFPKNMKLFHKIIQHNFQSLQSVNTLWIQFMYLCFCYGCEKVENGNKSCLHGSQTDPSDQLVDTNLLFIESFLPPRLGLQ